MKLVINNDRFNKLREMNLSGGSKVVVSAEGGSEIIHYTGEDYEGETVRETGLAYELANLITNSSLSSNAIIEDMRSDGVLDDYERGSFEFEDYVSDVILENWYNYLDVSTEHYDYKRGYTTVRAKMEITLGDLLAADRESPRLFSSWEVEVQTPMGTLKVE